MNMKETRAAQVHTRVYVAESGTYSSTWQTFLTQAAPRPSHRRPLPRPPLLTTAQMSLSPIHHGNLGVQAVPPAVSVAAVAAAASPDGRTVYVAGSDGRLALLTDNGGATLQLVDEFRADAAITCLALPSGAMTWPFCQPKRKLSNQCITHMHACYRFSSSGAKMSTVAQAAGLGQSSQYYVATLDSVSKMQHPAS